MKPPIHQPIGKLVDIGSRITSYNVCYTKLLRTDPSHTGLNRVDEQHIHIWVTGILSAMITVVDQGLFFFSTKP